MNEPRWYMAVLVVASHVEGDDCPLRSIDLQYRLVRATNSESAFQRAQEIGRSIRTSYRNAYDQTVTWQFLGLHDLAPIADEELGDGVEVYSRIAHADPQSLVRPKENLACFWCDANHDRTAEETLGERELG